MMTLILMLIVAVAAFNIVAALVMVVNEKRTDIAILRTVGITPRAVVGVFMTQGVIIGWFGALLGLALGLTLALERRHDRAVPRAPVRHARLRPDRVRASREVPSEVHWPQVVGITVDRTGAHGARHHLSGAARRSDRARRGVALRMKPTSS